MSKTKISLAMILFFSLSTILPAIASERPEIVPEAKQTAVNNGGIISFWPLFDYRSSPSTGYSNLSILGPLFKREVSGSATKIAVRPLFFSRETSEATDTDIVYPFASTSKNSDSYDSQVFRLYQNHISHKRTIEEKQETMLFPFYISGVSEKHGAYSSFLPFHGDIYERFWRDEYHYILFPFYGRTVKNGTTSSNYLYPFFSIISGKNESGFQIWPFYGQSEKKGVYDKRFVLWPFFSSETTGKDTANRSESLNLLPFYASTSSPKQNSIYLPWPFSGVISDSKGEVLERDYVWPFWMTAVGKDSHTERYLPFFSESKTKDTYNRWVLWPLYHNEIIDSPEFKQDKTSLLYFLFSKSDESWTKSDKNRSRSSLWPLYSWKRDEEGKRTLSMPALLEPIVLNEGVERNWSPLWRLFVSTWDNAGNSATSILWNLFWREQRGKDVAWEFSPLFYYHSQKYTSGFKILKGLFGYDKSRDNSSITLLWFKFGGAVK